MCHQAVDFGNTANLISQGLMQNAQKNDLQSALARFGRASDTNNVFPAANPDAYRGMQQGVLGANPDYNSSLMNLAAVPGGSNLAAIALQLQKQQQQDNQIFGSGTEGYWAFDRNHQDRPPRPLVPPAPAKPPKPENFTTPAQWLDASTDPKVDPAEQKRYRSLYDEWFKGQVALAGNKAEATGTKPNLEQTADLADQLRSGNLAPSLMSKRSSTYNATLAEANRRERAETGKPLNLNQLEIQYQGAKRFVGSMNGPQMTRYFGLANAVVNTIDEINSLANDLKQGGIQKWNQAKRGTILQVYGNTPQSESAARYVSAVNSLKEEFANLIQGGYAPTESAWALANKQINEDYGVKDLAASVNEVKRILNFRTTAFKSLTPQMGGAVNQPQSTGKRVIKLKDGTEITEE